MDITHYSQESCPICDEMKPELRKLKKEGIKVSVIDCDKASSSCKGIKYTPTIVIKKGRKSKKITGFATAEEIKKKYEKL